MNTKAVKLWRLLTLFGEEHVISMQPPVNARARDLYFASHLDANTKTAARNTDYFVAETLT